MTVFGAPEYAGHELVLHGNDPAVGLRAIIAIHDTSLGPAVGGCRMWPYESDEAALRDVLRLSRAMTYKCALAGLPFGGGKSVILGDPHADKSDSLLERFGRLVDLLGGIYRVGEDVGIGSADVEVMARATRHVAGHCRLDLLAYPVGVWSASAGQPFDQAFGAVDLVVATDLVELLPAVAHDPAGPTDVAHLLSQL